MTTNVGTQVRSIGLKFQNHDVNSRLFLGAKEMGLIMNSHGVSALEELAEVSRSFGTKTEDCGLLMIIHTWIKMYLSEFMAEHSTGEGGRMHRIAKQLQAMMMASYLVLMTWLDIEYLLEDTVALGEGEVEANVLDAAAKAFKGSIIFIGDIMGCRKEVARGYIRKVARGRYDNEHKLRALLLLGHGRWPSENELEDFEEQAKLVRPLLSPAEEHVLWHSGNEEAMPEQERWYRTGAVFAEACRQLADIALNDERCIEAREYYHPPDSLIHFRWRHLPPTSIPVAVLYIRQADLCFSHICAGPMRPWVPLITQSAGEPCREAARKYQTLALFTLLKGLRERLGSVGDSLSDTLAQAAARVAKEAKTLTETYQEEILQNTKSCQSMFCL
jgi:hypothetical protein